MQVTQEELIHFGIFHPVAVEQYMKVLAAKTRFVHYCSAETAFHIIRSKKMRLRNATVMNDFMEIEHGTRCLRAAWNSANGERFRAVVDGVFEGIAEELTGLLNGWVPLFGKETFISCLSEHGDDEDDLGRLSMWRAYGGPAGVAVVLNPEPFYSTSTVLGAVSSPVAYLDEGEFSAQFDRVTKGIETHSALLKGQGRQALINSLFAAFRFAVLCTKHPGFREEREWRIIFDPRFSTSHKLERSVELIRGVPQVVHSIPFKDYPEDGFVGAELPKLINRIIIGPTEFPDQLREATIALLQEASVPDAEKKVVCSTIPLRQ
ncbi:DUF2971 domain-containing protein [Mesorhizobium sp. B4-1-4]|uniref:DUF2971 domain-containing protein n=1 Tax=Mesorhizobium sp. B4-1-4 TaxID=2589888 RepID=UPI0011278693|nr:DUF2971 domain-containing protein [Mesorhizobium sp. B4-1-4]UCI32542.1 DUF2971 domain-containing protein [Mesorhizobium sp. B4-1-4]